ncbi:MAG: hydrogenase 3 maturation endopeptidase HyCI [Eubacteriales bacterium]|nr:hydrogenase 3 maturation endopeptidase HyCI [Eubacteriales bacterium]
MNDLERYFRRAIQNDTRVAVVGVGSELCRDDAAGMYFAGRLSEKTGLPVGQAGDRLLLIQGGPAPENFTGLVKAFRPDLLLVVDAAYLELPAGSIEILPEERAAGLSFSTHMLPLPMMLAYLKLECACETCLVGIQPATTEQGLGMTRRVQEGAELLADILVKALNA